MIDNPTYRGVVHPWMCDHMGHMNVMYYVNKFDEASWTFFAQLGLTIRRMQEDRIGVAGVQQNIAYHRELFPGETVRIDSHVVELRGKVIRFTHEMTHDETGEPCATCAFTVVHIDRETRKGIPFPDDVVARAKAAMKAA